MTGEYIGKDVASLSFSVLSSLKALRLSVDDGRLDWMDQSERATHYTSQTTIYHTPFFIRIIID